MQRAPFLTQGLLLPVVQPLGFGVEPGVYFLVRSQALVDVARFIHQIEHDAVFHRLAEFIGMDVAAEDFQAGLLVLLEQRRAGEADEDGIGQHGLHHAVQLSGLGAVALVDKDENLAHRLAGLRFQFLDELFEVISVALPELMDE